jgi:hypothetical protein
MLPIVSQDGLMTRMRTRSPSLIIKGVDAGPAFPLNVSQLNSMFMLFGIVLFGRTAYTCSAIRFSDTFGRPITNAHFTLVSADLPEPSPISLLGIGLVFFLAVAIQRMRCWRA